MSNKIFSSCSQCYQKTEWIIQYIISVKYSWLENNFTVLFRNHKISIVFLHFSPWAKKYSEKKHSVEEISLGNSF